MDQLALASAVTQRLGRDPFNNSSPRSIEVLYDRTRSGWSATLLVRESTAATAASRTITTQAPCNELEASVVLAVALVVDPNTALEPPAHRTTPTPTPTPPRIEEPRPAVPPLDPRAWEQDHRLLLRGGLLLFALPTPAFAITVGMDTARRGVWRASFGATRTLETLSIDGAYRSGAFGFVLTDFWGAGCIATAIPRLFGSVCAAAHFGIITGIVRETSVLEPVHPGDQPYLTLGVPLRGGIRIVDPVVVEVGVEPSIALLRQRFAIEGMPVPVFEQAIFALQAWLGVRLRLL